MELITIPYNDYKELLDNSMMYKDMNRELLFVLRNCGWNEYRKELLIDEELLNFMNKYIPNDVLNRTNELKEENKESEEK